MLVSRESHVSSRNWVAGCRMVCSRVVVARPADAGRSALFLSAQYRPATVREICSRPGDPAGVERGVLGAEFEFLARGDTALTRRARRHSQLSTVVVRWSRSRMRYERQGVVDRDGRHRAGRAGMPGRRRVRERRGQCDALHRAAPTPGSSATSPPRSARSFPLAPPNGYWSSTLAGRCAWRSMWAYEAVAGSAARVPAERSTRVRSGPPSIASARHEDTRYDELMAGLPRSDARELVRPDIDRVLRAAATPSARSRRDPRPAHALPSGRCLPTRGRAFDLDGAVVHLPDVGLDVVGQVVGGEGEFDRGASETGCRLDDVGVGQAGCPVTWQMDARKRELSTSPIV